MPELNSFDLRARTFFFIDADIQAAPAFRPHTRARSASLFASGPQRSREPQVDPRKGRTLLSSGTHLCSWWIWCSILAIGAARTRSSDCRCLPLSRTSSITPTSIEAALVARLPSHSSRSTTRRCGTPIESVIAVVISFVHSAQATSKTSRVVALSS